MELPDLQAWITARCGHAPHPWQKAMWEQWSAAGPPALWHPGVAWNESGMLDVMVLWLAHEVVRGGFRRLVWSTGRRGGERPFFLAACELARTLEHSVAVPGPLGQVARVFLAAARETGGDTPLAVVSVPGHAVSPQPGLPPGRPGILTSDLHDLVSGLLFAAPDARLAPVHAATLTDAAAICLVDTLLPLAPWSALRQIQTVLSDEPVRDGLPRRKLAISVLSRHATPLTGLPLPVLPVPDRRLVPVPVGTGRLVPALVSLTQAWLHAGALSGLVIVNHPATAVALAAVLNRKPDWEVTVLTGHEIRRVFDSGWQRMTGTHAEDGSISGPVRPRLWILSGAADVMGLPATDYMAVEVAPWDVLAHRLGQWDGTTPISVVGGYHRDESTASVWDSLSAGAGDELNWRDVYLPALCRLKEAGDAPSGTSAGWSSEGFRLCPQLTSGVLDLAIQTFPRPHPPLPLSSVVCGVHHPNVEVGVIWRSELDREPPETWGRLARVLPPAPAEACRVGGVELVESLRRGEWVWSDTRVGFPSRLSVPPDGCRLEGAMGLLYRASGQVEVFGVDTVLGAAEPPRLENGDTVMLPASRCPRELFSGNRMDWASLTEEALWQSGWIVAGLGPYLPGLESVPWQRWFALFRRRPTRARTVRLLTRLADYLSRTGGSTAAVARRLQMGLASGTPPACMLGADGQHGWVFFPWATQKSPGGGEWLPQATLWRPGWPLGPLTVTVGEAVQALGDTLSTSGFGALLQTDPWASALELARRGLFAGVGLPGFQSWIGRLEAQSLSRHSLAGTADGRRTCLLHARAPGQMRLAGWMATWEPTAPDWEWEAWTECQTWEAFPWEAMSVAAMEYLHRAGGLPATDEAFDLAAWLVSVVSGRGRPLPAVPGTGQLTALAEVLASPAPVREAGLTIVADINGAQPCAIPLQAPYRPQPVGLGGWASRFWRIQIRYGRWGAAWLETVWRWWVWRTLRRLAGVAVIAEVDDGRKSD